MTIAVLGPKNTFSDLARKHHWPTSKPLYASSIAQVFEWVEKGKAKQGLVPVENSSSGAVRESSAELKKRKVQVTKKVSYAVDLALAGVKKVALSKLRIIYSHPQAILQCRPFLRKHCRKAVLIPAKSTALFLSRIKSIGNPDTVVIASRAAIKDAKLMVLKNSIQGRRKNVTFFALITPPRRSF